MKFKAEIDVMPLKELLDPQGKAVGSNMKNVGLTGIEAVRIGKHIVVSLDAADEVEATAKVETACKNLLANLVMESYTYSITAL